MAVRKVSAKTRLRQRLAEIGLQSLTDWWFERKTHGWSDSEIWLAARDTAPYKARFSGLEDLRKRGRGISERAYIDFERTVYALGRQYQLPKSLLSRKFIAKLVSSEISPAELQSRLDQNVAAIDHFVKSNPEVQAQLAAAHQFYGVAPTRGDLLAMALDPQLGAQEATKRLQAIRAAASAQTTGFGALTRAEAESLTGYGLTPDAEDQGFGTLVDARELFNPLDQGEDAITREEQFGATFGGNEAARRRIEQRARKRKAEYEQGGGYASDKSGFAGLGSANT